MRKTILLVTLLCSVLASVSAQDTKGIKPLNAGQASTAMSAVTRAVVIGISDYQNPEIPDLQFAHRDAEAFAQWLRSPGGGSVPPDRLKVLLNQQATMAQMAAAFDWLMEVTQPGEQAIIYFSGHGDVERKTYNQPGFLLPWDSPLGSYMAGAYAVSYLQEIVQTLSLQNKAQVLVITDACHAGKLAGSGINGAQLTTTSLAQQFAQEVKILSCQPNEFSLEGPQWGGGRGVFSFHLMDGLYGMADSNNDGAVTLTEITHYLEDHVIPEAAPASQIPVSLGNRFQQVARVDASLLTQLKAFKSGQMPSFNPVQQRGSEETLLAGADSSIRADWEAYQLAVREKRFLEPVGHCADFYYARLAAAPALESWRGFLLRHYAAALQDDAQQALNDLMAVNVLAISQSPQQMALSYRDYPKRLERSAELLGPSHYMYKDLQARQALFEGLLVWFEHYYSTDKAIAASVLGHFREALNRQPWLPPAYFYMSCCFAQNLKEPDSAYHYARLAAEQAETWAWPYAMLAYFDSRDFKRFDEAGELLQLAEARDSAGIRVITARGSWYYYQKRFAEAENCYRRAIALDSSDALSWANLGIVDIRLGKREQAEQALRKSLAIDHAQLVASNALARLYADMGRVQEAEPIYKKVIGLFPGEVDSRRALANLYLVQNRNEEAEALLQQVVALRQRDSIAYYNLACARTRLGKQKAALESLEQSFLSGFRDEKSIREDPDLDPLRKLKKFKTLLRQYLPKSGQG